MKSAKSEHAFGVRAKGNWSAVSRVFASFAEMLNPLWRALAHRVEHRKSLVVLESAAVGERRFVTVVRFERQRFLIGSSASAVTLLARLPDDAVTKADERNEVGDES